MSDDGAESTVGTWRSVSKLGAEANGHALILQQRQVDGRPVDEHRVVSTLTLLPGDADE